MQRKEPNKESSTITTNEKKDAPVRHSFRPAEKPAPYNPHNLKPDNRPLKYDPKRKKYFFGESLDSLHEVAESNDTTLRCPCPCVIL